MSKVHYKHVWQVSSYNKKVQNRKNYETIPAEAQEKKANIQYNPQCYQICQNSQFLNI